MENDEVIRTLTAMTDGERQEFRNAEDAYIRVWEGSHGRPISVDELEAIRNEVIAMNRPLNDVMSYTLASSSLRRRAEAEQQTREEQTRSVERQPCASMHCRSSRVALAKPGRRGR